VKLKGCSFVKCSVVIVCLLIFIIECESLKNFGFRAIWLDRDGFDWWNIKMMLV